MTKKLIVILFLFFIQSTFSYASNLSDSKVILSMYLEAVKVYDTTVISELMHPEALTQFRASFDAALNGSKSDLAKSELLPAFGVQTIDEYKKLNNTEAYKRFNDFIVKSQPKLLELMKGSSFSIVGESLQGEISYITYTLTFNINGQTVNKDTVQKLKLNNGKWMLLLAPDSEASIAGLATRYN